MAVTVAQLRNTAREFADTGAYLDVELQVCIDDATTQVAPDAFGTSTDLAVRYLAAHMLATNHPEKSSVPGAKIRLWETAGSEDAGELGTTRYGIEFHRIRKSQKGARFPIAT